MFVSVRDTGLFEMWRLVSVVALALALLASAASACRSKQDDDRMPVRAGTHVSLAYTFNNQLIV